MYTYAAYAAYAAHALMRTYVMYLCADANDMCVCVFKHLCVGMSSARVESIPKSIPSSVCLLASDVGMSCIPPIRGSGEAPASGALRLRNGLGALAPNCFSQDQHQTGTLPPINSRKQGPGPFRKLVQTRTPCQGSMLSGGRVTFGWTLIEHVLTTIVFFQPVSSRKNHSQT